MDILCILGSTDGSESNTLLNTTIFYGLKKKGYNLDLITLRKNESESFDVKLSHYFDNVFLIKDNRREYKRIKNNKYLWLPFHIWTNIVKVAMYRPYNKKELKGIVNKEYDLVLAFCPPPLSAFFARDIIKLNNLQDVRYIQYWSDPLSIGMCDDITKIPVKRIFHKIVEKNALKDAKEIVYCSKCLCEMQQELYPQYSAKMRWSDVSYIEREPIKNKEKIGDKIKIGYFGAFQRRVRNIFPLMECAGEMSDLEFVIRGDTDVDINIDRFSNIDVKLGRRPYTEISALENECDILICLGNIKGVQIPGKVFYYTNLNKPIIYIGDGFHNERIKQYLAEFERYIICDNNRDSIKQAICKAVEILPGYSVVIHDRLKPENAAEEIVAIK